MHNCIGNIRKDKWLGFFVAEGLSLLLIISSGPGLRELTPASPVLSSVPGGVKADVSSMQIRFNHANPGVPWVVSSNGELHPRWQHGEHGDGSFPGQRRRCVRIAAVTWSKLSLGSRWHPVRWRTPSFVTCCLKWVRRMHPGLQWSIPSTGHRPGLSTL